MFISKITIDSFSFHRSILLLTKQNLDLIYNSFEFKYTHGVSRCSEMLTKLYFEGNKIYDNVGGTSGNVVHTLFRIF
jgi:hypothetical protein